MATRRIAGITIELNADTSEFVKGIRNLDSQLRTTQSNLRDINKLLKLDPGNTELLTQKQRNLTSAINDTKARLAQLKTAQKDALSPEDHDKLQREIIDTEQQLKGLQKEYKQFGSVAKQQMLALADSVKNAAGKFAELAAPVAKFAAAGAAATIAATTAATVALTKAMSDATKQAFELAKGAGQYADDLLTQSTVTGISTDKLQQYALVSKLVDTDTETITKSMAKLTKTMGSASKGTEGDIEKFKRLGIAIKDSNGNLRNSQDVFADAIDALGKISNETERDALAMDLFGKSAQDLNPLIEAGGEKLRQVQREAGQLGGVLSGKALAAMGEFDDSMQRLDYAANGLRQVIGSKLTPVFKPLVDAATKAVAVISKTLQGHGLTKGVATNLGKRLSNIVSTALKGLSDTISKAAPKLVIVVTALAKSVAGSLPRILQSLMPVITEGFSAIGEIIQQLAPVIANALPQLAQAVLPGLLNAAGSLVMGLINALPGILEALKTALVSLGGNIMNAIKENNPELYKTLEEIRDKASEIFGKLGELWDSFKKTVSDVFAAVSGFWNDTLKPVFDDIYDYVIRDLVPTLIVFWEYKAAPAIESAFTAIKGFWDETLKPVFEAIGTFVSETLAPTISDVFENKIAPAVETAFTAISGFWNDTLKPVFEAIGKFISETLAPAWSEFFEKGVEPVVKTAFDGVSKLWTETIQPLFQGWVDFFTGVFKGDWDAAINGLGGVFTSVFGEEGLLRTTISTAMEAIQQLIGPAFTAIQELMQPVFDWINDTFAPIFGEEGLQSAISGIVTWINDVFSGNWKAAWEGIVNLFGEVFATVGELMKAPINAVIDGINWMIDKIESAVNSIVTGINNHLKIDVDFGRVPDWVPSWMGGGKSLGGIKWSPNLSTVSWGRIEKLAQGGVLSEGRRAIVGEYAPEYLRVINGRAVVTPMNSGENRRMGETNNYTFNVYAQPGQSAQQIAAEVQRIMVRQQRQRDVAYA